MRKGFSFATVRGAFAVLASEGDIGGRSEGKGESSMR